MPRSSSHWQKRLPANHDELRARHLEEHGYMGSGHHHVVIADRRGNVRIMPRRWTEKGLDEYWKLKDWAIAQGHTWTGLTEEGD